MCACIFSKFKIQQFLDNYFYNPYIFLVVRKSNPNTNMTTSLLHNFHQLRVARSNIYIVGESWHAVSHWQLRARRENASVVPCPTTVPTRRQSQRITIIVRRAASLNWIMDEISQSVAQTSRVQIRGVVWYVGRRRCRPSTVLSSSSGDEEW